MLPKWQKHLPHKLHSQPHLPMETTSYGKAWRAFHKQNLGLCSTTYYLTVPITCTQTRIHHTQSLHYDKSLKCSSLRHIVTTNFAATIYRLLCKILLQRSLTRTISRWFIISMRFAGTSVINGERSEETLFSSIIVCITFAQYCCRLRLRTDKLHVLTSIFIFRFTLANELDEQYSLQDNNVGNFLSVVLWNNFISHINGFPVTLSVDVNVPLVPPRTRLSCTIFLLLLSK